MQLVKGPLGEVGGSSLLPSKDVTLSKDSKDVWLQVQVSPQS